MKLVSLVALIPVHCQLLKNVDRVNLINQLLLQILNCRSENTQSFTFINQKTILLSKVK